MEKENNSNTFKKTHSLHDWEVAAREELNGADPWEKLSYEGEGWRISPFYNQNQINPAPLLTASENNFSRPRSWFNCPLVHVYDAKKANETALQYLKDGADGISFELRSEIDFQILLTDIEWRYCSLNFLAKENHQTHATALDAYISRKKINLTEIHGAFFGDFIPQNLLNGEFRFVGFQFAADNSPVEELINGFKKIIRSKATSAVAINISVDTDFFLSIAKIRASQLLWTKYLGTIGINPNKLFIHVYSPAWIDKNFQPHGNMLKSTYAAISAILGGCDVVTIEPEDSENKTMSRAARNVSNILREESYFSTVADPLAGSYFIEDLTNQLVESAWASIKPVL